MLLLELSAESANQIYTHTHRELPEQPFVSLGVHTGALVRRNYPRRDSAGGDTVRPTPQITALDRARVRADGSRAAALLVVREVCPVRVLQVSIIIDMPLNVTPAAAGQVAHCLVAMARTAFFLFAKNLTHELPAVGVLLFCLAAVTIEGRMLLLCE